jgi:poly-gamma-glutamate synthesis protein (capsule biosynthesis protein)
MIIVGDIAIPNKALSEVVSKAIIESEFKNNQSVIFNLEGLITDDYSLTDKNPVLFNHSSVQDVFKGFDVKVAALANNHTLDLPQYLKTTKGKLKHNGYLTIGAGSKNDDDFEVVSFTEAGKTIYLINACWDFLLYNQNIKNENCTVNIIREQKIMDRVAEINKKKPNAKIVLYFHWNFDLEILPFPSQRKFSKALIDHGASLIIGGHSHCVQGGERYKDGYIVYGLGNFFIPNGIYANCKLNFPEMSYLGLVLEWDIVNDGLFCNWFEYNLNSNQHSLTFIGRDPFDKSSALLQRSPYQKLHHEEYIPYFIKNRRKKKLVPVFKNFDVSIENKSKMFFLKSRALIARKLAELGLIGWQN